MRSFAAEQLRMYTTLLYDDLRFCQRKSSTSGLLMAQTLVRQSLVRQVNCDHGYRDNGGRRVGNSEAQG